MPNDLDNEALIQATSLKLNLNQFAVEKDFYLTKAIDVLTAVQNNIFKLVFQGGTALVKAHQFIQRMSEDCDFRLAYRDPNVIYKKDAQRKLLRKFREQLIQALKENGFQLADDAIKVRNQGQFITMNVRYQSIYKVPSSLKPYIALEFFLGHLKTPPIKRKITSLIQQTLGEKVDHPIIELDCMSIPETAAEKWVALTRRIATIEQREHYYEQSLVRHLYDLAMIEKHYALQNSDFAKLVSDIVENDRKHFKSHSDLYHQNPLQAVNNSLHELKENAIWSSNWDAFMNAMVYGQKISYQDALNNLTQLSQLAIKAIDNTH